MCPVCAQVRKFKVVNTGSLGVTFTMDTKSLEKSGFTVTPDKLPLLAGAPVHASLELTVTLQVSVCAHIAAAVATVADATAADALASRPLHGHQSLPTTDHLKTVHGQLAHVTA